jgi:predicted nucleic acid-binding protein
VNVFIKGKHLPTETTQELISSYFNLPITLNKEPTSGVFLRLPDICQEYGLTAYDALYVATALEEDCQLISDNIKGHGKITDGTIVMLENYKPKTKKITFEDYYHHSVSI